MTLLAPTLQAFFTDRLIRQRRVSPETVAAYRDALKLLLAFAQQWTGKHPSRLGLADVDVELVGAFLDHLEQEPADSQRQAGGDPLAVPVRGAGASRARRKHRAGVGDPPKRFDRRVITYLTEPEIDALLAAPDQSTWTGRRDHALLALAVQAGLRASELIGLCCADVNLGTGAHVHVRGKGRKERIAPLTNHTRLVLRAWLDEREGLASEPVFPTARAGRLSRDALERRLAKHLTVAAQHSPTLVAKPVTMHVLRHTAAMRLLHAEIDSTVIALWLRHESVDTTKIYLHTDLELRQKAIARTTRPPANPVATDPPDTLLAFLEAL